MCLCLGGGPRKQDNVSVSVRTLCHHPQMPIERVLISNYSTTQCVMVPQPSEEGNTYICGCTSEQECNDMLIFDKGSNGNLPS